MPALRVSHAPVLGLMLVTGALVLSACGGSSGSASSTPTSSGGASTATATTGGPAGAAFARFSACLKQHGVTLQGRGPGGAPGGAPPQGTTATQRPAGGFGGATGTRFRAAQTACARLLPAGARRIGARGFGGGQGSAAFAAYRNCLTLHGVRTTGAGAFRLGRPGGAKPTAKETAALTACASLRPAFGRPAGSAPGSTTPATTTGSAA